jgi:DMSO/TMAO reductase YedYZ molybdopterin-dependent catalytic subunit
MAEQHEEAGAPVGRRIVLGLLAAGAVGVVTGHRIQDALSRALAPIQTRDPTGLSSLIPLGDTFRYYSVTGAVPERGAADYRLAVSGLVRNAATYTLADLAALPQTDFVRDFQCVTGWRVPQVPWGGVRLSELLDRAGPLERAAAVRFTSFDGAYTESFTMEQARSPEVMVALRMYGAPLSHDHGGPVRVYAAPMYGYKSTKWLSGIEVVDRAEPGYWEKRGYDIDGYIEY